MHIVKLPWRLDAYRPAVKALLRTSFGDHASVKCHPRRHWWGVVTSRGDLVAAANVDADAGVLWDLCVAPAARRRGVATRLLRHVAARAPAPPGRALRLFIDSWDLAPFYRRRRFAVEPPERLPPGVVRPARAVACMVRRKSAQDNCSRGSKQEESGA